MIPNHELSGQIKNLYFSVPPSSLSLETDWTTTCIVHHSAPTGNFSISLPHCPSGPHLGTVIPQQSTSAWCHHTGQSHLKTRYTLFPPQSTGPRRCSIKLQVQVPCDRSRCRNSWSPCKYYLLLPAGPAPAHSCIYNHVMTNTSRHLSLTVSIPKGQLRLQGNLPSRAGIQSLSGPLTYSYFSKGKHCLLKEA